MEVADPRITMDGTMRSQGRPALLLWNACWNALQPLRPAFSRQATTFMWFATVVVGMMVRSGRHQHRTRVEPAA